MLPSRWQPPQSPVSLPQPPPAPSSAPVRVPEAERVAPAPEAQRSPSLLNRASGLSRPGLSKMGGHTNTHVALRGKVHQRLVEELAQGTDSVPAETVRQRISELLNDIITEQNITMSRPDRLRLVDIMINDVLGLGPLEELLAREDVTEIMINSYKQIYVEQHGKLTLSPVTFESNDQLVQVIDRIVSSIGRRVDESSPMVDARLKDGSRVNVIIPPLALAWAHHDDPEVRQGSPDHRRPDQLRIDHRATWFVSSARAFVPGSTWWSAVAPARERPRRSTS